MSNIKVQMPNKAQNPNVKVKFDLEERTALFGEDIIDFAKTLPKNSICLPLIDQIVRSGTSIGANYMEADGAGSKKEFLHRISICKREAKETMHWFRMIAKACPESAEECRKLWQEAHELTLIFSAIINKGSSKS